MFLSKRAYKEHRKRSWYAKVMDFTSSGSKIQGCQASPRRGTVLPQPGMWLRASNQWKRIGLTPHDVAIPCHDVAHPKNAPINRFQGLRVPLLSSLLSRAETLRLSPWDPPKAPVFTFKSGRKVLCSRDSRQSRDFSPAFNSSCRSSARFFSRLFQINHFNQVSSYPYNYAFKCFVNAFIHF